jgi:hypothetical protein
MLPFLLPILASAVVFLLYLALAAAAMRGYRATGDKRFVWLEVGLIGWLIVSRLLDSGWTALVLRSLQGHPEGFFPFSLIRGGLLSADTLLESLALLQHVIGMAVLLAIQISISKDSKSRVAARVLAASVL